MSSDYSYDDQAQFFPFFILTLTGLVTVPLTYTLLRPGKDQEELAPRIQSDYKIDHASTVETLRSALKRKQWRVKRAIFVVVGWAIMGAMVYLIMVTQRSTPKLWNPYDILGISESATEKQIKSHYKRLSVKYHPDKIRPDPAKNETAESLNNYYVELTKAYQALTDEDVRNNYIQYGHPDGKQSFSMGIALPKFIVSDGNGKYVVLMYTLLLGVLLPWLVGSWWYGTKRRSKEGVLMESANKLFQKYDDRIEQGAIVSALSIGKEFEHLLKGEKAESDLAKIEARILAETGPNEFAAGLSVKDKEKLEDLDNGARRKALALLWAYLGRVELNDPVLTKAKYEVAPIASALNRSFLAISLAFGNIKPIIASFQIGQRLVQAIPPEASPLRQLPYITPAIAKAIEGEDARTHMSVQSFMKLSDARRRELSIGPGLLTPDQYKTAINVAQQYPNFVVSKAFFKVTGEKCIIPNSLVTLVIKGRFIPLGAQNVPAVNELDLEDIDPVEGDVEALNGRKKKTIKGPDGTEIPIDEEKCLPPLAFAPHYAEDHAPKWHALLGDSKQGKVVIPPFPFESFDRPIVDEKGNPTFHMQTLKAKFAAPPQPAKYTFVLHVICDSYVGFDTKMEVVLRVEEASKAAEMQADDDISEPDEDSIAGQMQALKTGQAPKPRRKQDSSDDESGTEEEDEDTSATNTDTEDES